MPRLTFALVPPLLLSLFLATGCSQGPEGSRGTGAVLTSDGRFVPNTDRNERNEVCKHIASDLGSALGAEWKVAVTIDELPVWKPGILEGDGDWRWQEATAHVALTGNGTPRLTTAEITAAVEQYLAKRAKKALVLVTITGAVAVTTAAAAVPAATTGVRTYTVQAGDTLADITTLFYGSPGAWRTIVAANPGLDPAALQPGTTLTIPAKPE
jgi:LysM repeat protein